jgi:hypothetical protein
MANSMFGQVQSVFNVVGELQERRLITSDKMKGWELHIFKVLGKGCTLEIQVTKDEYDKGVLKDPYHLAGYITVEAGRTKLIAETVKRLAPVSAS